MRTKLRVLMVFGCGWLLSAALFELASPLPVPVAGISSARLQSTFGAPRSGGRKHQGVDIFAPRGTAVVAAVHGVVIRIGQDGLGGNVAWTLGSRGVLCYYAHLDDYAPGLEVGDVVDPDTVIGYVGNTGNARTTRPHLHFETRPIYRALVAVDPVVVMGGRVSARPNWARR